MSSQQHTGVDTCLHVCVCVWGVGGGGVSCVWVWAIVYVCICHLRDRKKIFLASKDKNEVLKLKSWSQEQETEESNRAFPSHRSDLNSGPPAATLPGASHYRVRARTGWPGVRILWLGEIASLICHQNDSMHNCLSRLVPQMHCASCWDVKQPANKPQCVQFLYAYIYHEQKMFNWGKPYFYMKFTMTFICIPTCS